MRVHPLDVFDQHIAAVVVLDAADRAAMGLDPEVTSLVISHVTDRREGLGTTVHVTDVGSLSGVLSPMHVEITLRLEGSATRLTGRGVRYKVTGELLSARLAPLSLRHNRWQRKSLFLLDQY